MSRRKKWILAPLGLFAALVLLLVLVFDWSWLEGIVEDQASSALGRPVEMAGFDVDFDWDLTPRVFLDEVRIANPDWAPDEPMAEVPHAEVEIDLWALLGGDIVLPDVQVERPTVRLIAGADGRTNWQFGGQQDSAGPPSVPVVGNLEISGANVRYADLAAGHEVTAELATVEGQAPAEGDLRLVAEGESEGRPLALRLTGGSRSALESESEPFPFALDLELGDQSLTLAGSATQPLQAAGLSATVRLRSDTPDQLLALIGIPERGYPPLELDGLVHRDGDVVRFEQLDLRLGQSDLQGSGEVGIGGGPLRIRADLSSDLVRVTDLNALWRDPEAAPGTGSDDPSAAALERAQATLEQARRGADPVTDPETPEAPEEPRLGFSFAELPRWTVDVQYRAGAVRGPDFEVTDLDLEARLEDQVPYVAGSATGSYAGEPVQLDVALGTADGPGSASPYPVDVRAEAGASRLRATGTIADVAALRGIDIELEAQSPEPNRLLQGMGVDAPDIPPFEIAGRLLQKEATWRLEDFLGRVGESQLQGTAALDRSGEVPLLTADLTSSRLIAADFMPEGETPAQEEEEEGGEEAASPVSDDGREIISIGGVNLGALPDLDVDIQFEGQYVEVPEFRFEPVRVDLRIIDKIPVATASGQGAFRDSPLDFDVQLGTDAFFDDRDAPYPFDVRLEAGDTRLIGKGTVAEPGTYTGLDVDVSLEGPNLDQLGDILKISLPHTPSYALAGQLTRDGARWQLEGLDGRIGDSDVHGVFAIDFAGVRPLINADLHSESLDFDDLAPLIGAGPNEQDEQDEQDGQIIPDQEIEVPDLKRMDARVAFRGDNVNAPKLPLETVVIDLTLDNGRLHFEPLRFEIAGGQLDATIDLDATPRPIEGAFDIALRNVDLQRLLGGFEVEVAEIETEREGRGILFGRARLAVTGNSLAEMLGNADGQVAVLMDGGRINALIVEGLGLDVGEALGLLIADDEERAEAMVPVNCFVADFEVQDGVMQTEALVLDTDDSKIVGAGRINLDSEQLDLRLKALPRDASVLTAGTPVLIQGRLADPAVEVVTEELVEKGFAAAALGVVLPVVGAVLPFIETGEKKVPNNCSALLDAAAEAEAASGGESSE